MKAALYRHKELVYDPLLECHIEGPWIMCPKLAEVLDAEPPMPSVRREVSTQ